MHSWHGKALYIDLSSKKTSVQSLSREFLARFIGGRGLGVELMKDFYRLDPYDPAMPLIFAVGPLCGTPAPASTRMSVVSRSPLTGTITDSSVGGVFPIKLKAAGYDVKSCCGPETFQCPILEGQRCTYCEDGEVLVYDPWLQPLGEESDSFAILGMLRWSYPRKPIVVAGGLGSLSPEIRALAQKDPMVKLLPTPTAPGLVVEAVREMLSAS